MQDLNKEDQAKSILTSAFINKKKRVIARHELDKKWRDFNPDEYQEKIIASRKKYQSILSENKTRPPKKITKEHTTKLRQARKSLQSTDLLIDTKPKTGRPARGNQSTMSRLSTYSSAPTEYEGFGGAVFTPKRNKK